LVTALCLVVPLQYIYSFYKRPFNDVQEKIATSITRQIRVKTKTDRQWEKPDSNNQWKNQVKEAQKESKIHSTDDVKNLSMEIPLYLHLGKSGGGTVWDELKLWKIDKVHRCHPNPGPCKDKIRKAKSLLISIRDPVERFVSAFNWRSLLVCKDFNETRTKGHQSALRNPIKHCKPMKNKEKNILLYKYKSNVNNLAMALCKKQNKGAIKDVKHIQHAKYSLSDWLHPSGIWHNSEGGSKLIPVVLEHGYNITKQTYDSIRSVF